MNSSSQENSEEIIDYSKIDTKKRHVDSIPAPATHRLSIEELYKIEGKPDYKLLRDHLKQEGRVTDECALKIIRECTEILKQEDTMLRFEDLL